MDREFIGGNFFDLELPPEKRYLYKYFATVLQEQYLRYYFVFNGHDNFVDHTGIACTKPWLERLREKLILIEATMAKAKKDFDHVTVRQIIDGRYKFTNERKP